jgi:pyruvate/2-oxoglutarate/acetoin dehydrogenase E1 component
LRTISYTEALREALQEEMIINPDVFLLGEDIGIYGGAFGVTRGLLDKFGAERVRDTPISEQGFVGASIGAALAGSRPVVEIMFMDFITLAVDQMVNQAAKLHYVLGKQARCPMVLRTVGGGGRCYGPTHSQSLEAWFTHVPGLKVVAPSTPADAKGLLKAAIRDDNPVVFMEHKLLYGCRGEVSEAPDTVIPLGKARIARAGTDITLIAWSWMSAEAGRAAEEDLNTQGISAEVIDLRSLIPLDMDTIIASVKKTHRALIVQESCRTGGFGAEISARISETVYDYLDAPLLRLATPDIPLSASPALERAAIPDRSRIFEAARKLVEE